MPAGRPPKPIEQKRKLGNPGKRPLPEVAIALPAALEAIPAPPYGLRRRGKEVWCRLWTIGKSWLSPESDWDVLVRLCQLHDEREQLLKVIRVNHMVDDLEILADVLDEREDAGDSEEQVVDAGPLVRLLFKRIRALEQHSSGGSEIAEPTPPKKQTRKRARGRAPLTGYFALGSTGQMVLHPAVKSLRLVEAEIRRLESLCGFNPSDRSRLGLAIVKGASKLEELLAKRAERQGANGREGAAAARD